MKALIDRQMRKATKRFYDTTHEVITEMITQGYHDGIKHNPRLVMYKLLPMGLGVTKKDVSKVQAVVNALKYKGVIDNNMTIDTTRTIHNYNSFNGVDELLHYASQWYYVNRWNYQPVNILLMCEASGYLGVMEKIAKDYRISYVPAKGDMSVQLKIDIANTLSSTKKTIILYFGDYDIKGVQIPKTIENDIRLINPDGVFEMKRMFINKHDIEKYSLAVDETGVQLEQLPTDIAIKVTKSVINDYLDQAQWHKSLNEELRGREEIVKAAS